MRRQEAQVLRVELLDGVAAAAPTGRFRVLPSLTGGTVTWVDAAGFPLARSERPRDWAQRFPLTMDFTLDSQLREVTSEPYV
jgi:hypothetical protein